MEAADGDIEDVPVAGTEDHAARLLELSSLVGMHANFPFRQTTFRGKDIYVGQIVLDEVEDFIDAVEAVQGCQYNMSKGGDPPLATAVLGKERETFTIAGKTYMKARVHSGSTATFCCTCLM